MTEVQVGAGDSVSRLLQVYAREIGLKRVWNPDGKIAARELIVELYNTRLLRDKLWDGIQELYALPELKELPESFQAKLMAVILHARACAELETKAP